VTRNAPVIDSYGPGGFRLSGAWRKGSVLILADEARSWPVSAPAEVTPDSLAAVLEAGRAEAEFLILGMGEKNALPPRALRDAVARAGLGLEFMDTGSAARLYNVLTSEGRRLAAALIAL
jgi:uncharacterized protein